MTWNSANTKKLLKELQQGRFEVEVFVDLYSGNFLELLNLGHGRTRKEKPVAGLFQRKSSPTSQNHRARAAVRHSPSSL